ncbi:MAG: hypothetical protein AAGK38_04730 [Pseudomonadota bacterium]
MSFPPDPDNPLAQLTHRELLANRAMARRAAKRGRNKERSQALVQTIEAELDRRRTLRAERIFSGLPSIAALDD